MPLDLTDHKSAWVQVMDSFPQATGNITWANVDLDVCRYMASLNNNELNVTMKKDIILSNKHIT